MPTRLGPRGRTRAAAVRTVGLAVGLAAAVWGLSPSGAAAAVAIEGTFTARAACPAYQSFNAGTNPGTVVLDPGTIYGAFERNRPDGPWVRLRVPGANPMERWVARECGRLDLVETDPAAGSGAGSGAAPMPLTGPADSAGSGMTDGPRPLLEPSNPDAIQVTPLNSATPAVTRTPRFQPVFDSLNQGPEDPTPPAPALGPVDQAVLGVCGGWGGPVSEAAFRGFLEAQPSLRDSMVAALHGNLDTLVRAWTAAGGFRHILCGEPDQRDDGDWALGGLHYQGRYLQAQRNGWLGLLQGGCSVVETDPPVYTAGVEFLTPDGGVGTKCINGYALGLTAPDILLEVTKIFRLARDGFGGRSDVCRYRVLDDGNAYYAVFVMRDGAIRTFYPDATPDESLPICGQ